MSINYEVAAWQAVKAMDWTDMMGATVIRPVDSWHTGTVGVPSSVQVMLPATIAMTPHHRTAWSSRQRME